mgnify:CR=1 FL=1
MGLNQDSNPSRKLSAAVNKLRNQVAQLSRLERLFPQDVVFIFVGFGLRTLMHPG